MAKKKVSHSHQEKPQKMQEDFVKPQQESVTPAMDSEASEKLESLKSLNQMLLKEAFERRQQVDSLIQSKGSLESELARSESEKEELKSELTQLGERAAVLELERSVVDVFVAEQLSQKGEEIEREMKGLEIEMTGLKKVIDEKESEIAKLNEKLGEAEGELGNEREVLGRVRLERDHLKDELHLQIEEGKGLKKGLIELEKRKEEIEGEIRELRSAYDVVEEEERRIKSIVEEKDLIERSLAESNKLVEEIKEQLSGVIREKKGIEKEKNAETVKRRELEDAVSGLNELVVSLRKEEEKLRANVADLEKKVAEGEEIQEDRLKEIYNLVEGLQLSNKRVEGLTNEKDKIEKDLEASLKQVDERRRKIEELVSEKTVVLEAKGRLDAEVSALRNQVNELNSVIVKLEESGASKMEKITGLESEVGEYSWKLEQVKGERDEFSKCLKEEKENAVRLMGKIEDLEKKMEENLKAFGEAKAENAAIISEKIELDTQCATLKNEIASLRNTLVEAQNEFGSSKRKLELADASSELVLNMLKETVAFCSKDEKNDLLTDGTKLINGEESKPHVVEMEKIKNAFKKKETKVENMKRELELLQNSVESAHKKKSFWTVISSATTLLAAISLAYAARVH